MSTLPCQVKFPAIKCADIPIALDGLGHTGCYQLASAINSARSRGIAAIARPTIAGKISHGYPKRLKVC